MQELQIPDYIKEETKIEEGQEQFVPKTEGFEITSDNLEDDKPKEGAPSENNIDDIIIDDDIPAVEGEKPKDDDFTTKVLETINKDLGAEYKSLEELKNEVITLKNEKDRLALIEEQQEKLFANDDIKRANEVAKSGGDFKEFLSLAEAEKSLTRQAESIKSASNEDLVKAWLINLNRTEEQIEQYFSNKEDFEIEEKASELRHQELSYIDEEVKKIGDEKLSKEQAAKNTINEFRSGVHDAFKSINLGGVKLSPALLEKAKGEILRGTDLNTIPRVEGKLQVQSYVENKLKAQFFDKVVEMARKNGASKGAKEVFNNLSNVDDVGGRIVPQGSNQGDGNPLEALFGKLNY